MCGRFFLINSPLIRELMQALDLESEEVYQSLRFSDDIAPGSTISIIQGLEPRVKNATWWLLLDTKTYKPNYKFVSFNSRSQKLHQHGSLAYVPFRTTRCIIPASGFVEGLGDKKTYHQIEMADQAIAFGGLYREWTPPDREPLYSASIITLPPHPKWDGIHKKACPLTLPWNNQNLIRDWLNPATPLKQLDSILEPHFRTRQIITPIDRPSSRTQKGEPFFIEPD